MPGRSQCVSPKLVVGPAGVPDAGCSTCFCRDHAAPPRAPGICTHLGPRIGALACLPCTDKLQRPISIPLHSCALHGQATVAQAVGTEACCFHCLDHLPQWIHPTAGQVRHLMYHMHPAGPWWRWHCEQLRRRLPLFNGRRVVGIAVDAATASPDQVMAEIATAGIEYFVVANRADVREMTTHPTLLAALSDLRGQGDVTWYGQSKGSGSHVFGPQILRWCEEMYRGTLDYWPAVERELKQHCLVGCFRRTPGPAGLPWLPWHYSGTFRWVRNSDLYSRNWSRAYGPHESPETIPGTDFRLEESSCLYGEFARGSVGLYRQSAWDTWAAAACEEWRAAHVADRTDWQSLGRAAVSQ